MKKQTTPSHPKTSNKDRIHELEKRNEELEALVSWYEGQFKQLQTEKFGRSSEKTNTSDGQIELPLFNEVEITQDSAHEEPQLNESDLVSSTQKNKRKRSSHELNLPVEKVTYHLPEAERNCESCGHDLHVMTTETNRTLEIIPASVKVTEHAQEVYACRQCQESGIETPIIKAPKPASVYPKSMASASSMAYVLTQKYQSGLPLYRQEQLFKQQGIPLSRQTMANWAVYGADQWLSPLVTQMKAKMMKEAVLHADETSVQVLNEEGRAASSTSYMWLYRTGQTSFPCVVYDYKTTRAGKNPKEFLKDFKGFLHVDGYAGYHKVANVKLSGCWAHARRYFVKAAKSAPKKKGELLNLPEQAVQKIGQLYKIEKEIRELNLNSDKRHQLRKEKSLPIAEAYFEWLKKIRPTVLPKSPLGEAIVYSLNQKDALLTPFSDGRLEIDNNLAERSIKPFVIGRKNWLFSNSMKGADTSALIYSVIESAKENDLKPFEYLTYLFEKMPNTNLSDQQNLDQFLPWSKQIPDHCRIEKVNKH